MRLWDLQTYEACANWLEKFSRDFPRSRYAAEAAYKRACALLLLDKKKEARQAFDELVQNHLDSPWAKLALIAHYDQDALLDAGKTLSQQARKQKDSNKSAALGKAAIEALKVRQARFPNAPNKEQAAYLIAVGHRVSNAAGYLAALGEVQKIDANGVWGKMAAMQQCDAESLRKHMDELIDLNAPDRENLMLFLELAEKLEGQLPAADQMKCRFLKARCYEDKQKEIEVYAAIVKDHAKSPWAVESAFWLAEKLFADQKHAEAQAAYRTLVAKYPNSPRAAQARRLADWIDHLDATRPELEKALAVVIQHLSREQFSLAFEMSGESSAKKKPLEFRLAWQGTEQFSLQARYGQVGGMVAGNAKGTWYHFLGATALYHDPGHLKLPMPQLVITADRHTGVWNFQGNLATDAAHAQPSIQIASDFAPVLARMLTNCYHIDHEIRKDVKGTAHTVFIVHNPGWDPKQTQVLEFELNARGMLQEIRCRNDKSGAHLRISGIVIGEPLPAAIFEVTVPAGVAVQTVQQINPLELYAQAMRLFGELSQDVQAEVQKH
jgi:outer membrane protein assembly factor BamD (BamD/ComL family)